MTQTTTAPKGAGRLAARARMALAAVTFGGIVTIPVGEDPSAKTPGSRYCFLRVCHRVLTLEETRARIGKSETVQASFYDSAGRDRFNPSNLTSSGEYFRAGQSDNAASPIYPDGTKVLVWNPANKRAAIVRINNAGPYYGRRLLDLSRGAAEKLGVSGVSTVVVRVIEAPTRAEATYRRGRTYPPVPGYIGSYGNLELAFLDAGRALGRRIPVETFPAPSIVVAANDLAPLPEMGAYVVAPAARSAESVVALADPSIAAPEILPPVERPVEALVAAAAPVPSVEPEPAPPARPIVVAAADPVRLASAVAATPKVKARREQLKVVTPSVPSKPPRTTTVAKAPHPSRQLAAAERPKPVIQANRIRTAAVSRRAIPDQNEGGSGAGSGIEIDSGKGIPRPLSSVH